MSKIPLGKKTKNEVQIRNCLKKKVTKKYLQEAISLFCFLANSEVLTHMSRGVRQEEVFVFLWC